LHHFRDTARYLSKFADFTLPHLHLVPPLGVTPFEFRKNFWHQKTRVPGLSCGVVCVFLRLAILVEHRLVTDRQTQTDRQTDRQTHGHGIYRESYCSRGKNANLRMVSTRRGRTRLATSRTNQSAWPFGHTRSVDSSPEQVRPHLVSYLVS